MRSLRWKWTLIVGVVLLSAAGMFANKIRLGLDLKGGSHVVLQIQIQDAFKASADVVIESLQAALGKQSIAYRSIERNDPSSIQTAKTIQILVKGVPLDRTADFRRIVNDLAGQEWALAAAGDSDFRLDLRGEAAARLSENVLRQSIQTIERKVNGLGVAEASVQARGGSGGDTEILVQLPGVDDPGRIKSILQTTALLELAAVQGRPIPEPRRAARPLRRHSAAEHEDRRRRPARRRGRELVAALALARRDRTRSPRRAGGAGRHARASGKPASP